ncbi:VOC family protein [Chitinophaga rhizophila]|uniref:VOC family protein n=1 Tax=Chitinophaga rhizophila TaxID=2866212 RepID=A0ABS7G6D9_9BACT|nr:VOC family protein [Chitinophaga rhizophila]MBW8683212.1 VOC family protein [Chitinophaga rhizophila]
MEKKQPGAILWHDLTVPDAAAVSEFYKQVVGWEKIELSMGDYDDYLMKHADNGPQGAEAGICHARGGNAYLPPQWLVYVVVDNLEHSLAQCTALGGKVLGEQRKMGKDAIYCLIQDPAGAYMMLYQQF